VGDIEDAELPLDAPEENAPVAAPGTEVLEVQAGAAPSTATGADVVSTANPANEAATASADRSPALEQVKVDAVAAAVDRLTERLRADQDVIGRMQSRIESLQGDQVRALLGPAVTELANLHAAFAESAERDYERLGFDRVRKEFTLLGDRLESAIDVLGATSVDARVGDAFDSRVHQAVKQVPTSEPGLDKTIAAVLRQGFTFDPDGKPALYARVSVHAFDPALVTAVEPSTTSASTDGEADLPDTATPLEVAPPTEGELELPYPLDPQ
jgi:molecular chaperone GrpE (heat shock protein)